MKRFSLGIDRDIKSLVDSAVEPGKIDICHLPHQRKANYSDRKSGCDVQPKDWAAPILNQRFSPNFAAYLEPGKASIVNGHFKVNA
ncbi:hypothetical protein [Iningainema tapete]|uniref:hypothetical protein n=1 Tax=Iningainema tapete TaxID=2806730 RepID=UPI001EE16407|nr:hypothetical protein [Iningainema tapete]